MATLHFTSHLQRYLPCPDREVDAGTLADALQQVFDDNPQLAGYIVDEQRRLRRNIAIFVDGRMLQDRDRLGDRLQPGSQVYVMQALSGG